MGTHPIFESDFDCLTEMGEAKKLRGNLHQPHSAAAANASIPTRYSTYVINNSEDKKGFTSKSKRFLQTFNDSPGPGTYQTYEGSSNPSFGKKGTGGFASRSSRMPRFKVKSCPNPTSYELSRELTDRRDFNKQYSSSFQPPIASEKKYSVTRQPAPNQYDTIKAFSKVKDKRGSCDAAFKSKTKRSLVQIIKSSGSNLSPAQYELHSKNEERAVTSCFRSQTERQLNATRKKNIVPGPGTYDPKLEMKMERPMTMPFRKHCLTMSAPAMPMPPDPPSPGPGSYEIVDYNGPSKKFMASAVFKSGSSRWIRQQNTNLPGPGFYDPSTPRQMSYLYSTDNKWLPA